LTITADTHAADARKCPDGTAPRRLHSVRIPDRSRPDPPRDQPARRSGPDPNEVAEFTRPPYLIASIPFIWLPICTTRLRTIHATGKQPFQYAWRTTGCLAPALVGDRDARLHRLVLATRLANYLRPRHRVPDDGFDIFDPRWVFWRRHSTCLVSSRERGRRSSDRGSWATGRGGSSPGAQRWGVRADLPLATIRHSCNERSALHRRGGPAAS
jgi:hypothetical protein